ncbi:hypothetical protein BOX15_Mlig024226g1 [Macrostomum lignano]|uniref:RING-type domain-containing protein n=1 Tax=Macrostomum lignano TaxID=282301 RepID=A0A267H4B8_9PLAT|nr:hypothetical protein BOX15_Mlig024226g1 [Macrostomum lignano]
MPSPATEEKRLKELESKLKQGKRKAQLLLRESNFENITLEDILQHWNGSALKRNTDFFKSVEAVYQLEEKKRVKQKELDRTRSENIPDGLECGVCLDWLADSRLLVCGHSFCRNCLYRLYDAAENNIICPMCRIATIGQVDQLNRNYSVEAAIQSCRK